MTIRSLIIHTAALALAAVMLPARADVTLNLKDADISTLIATVSEVTGKNFIVDARVKGKVTVISAAPMSEAGLYETFLAILSVNGYAVIPSGEAYKIIPEASARTEGSSVFGKRPNLAIDDVVTHVYQLKNINAAQLVPILRPLVPQWGHLAAYQPNNALIISDRAANVERIGELITQMDQAGDREIEYVHLEFASASEVVRILTSMTTQDKQVDPTNKPATIIADERSNSILVGGDKSERQKFIDVIKQLDIPLKDDGATQVIYLRYASAENLAPILEGYAQQVGKSKNAGEGGAPPAAASGGSGGTYENTKVLADTDTNALIVTAPPKTMRQVRDVIAQLDIQRAQVLVEAIVAEVGANKSSQLGVDWAVFNGDRIAAAGILDPTTLSALASVATTGSATAGLSAIGQGLNLVGGVDGGSNGTSFGLLLKALKGDGDSNVLSTPTLVTMDNEEAKFSVGQEVPFQTGSFSSTGTTTTTGVVNPFQTIERKDVGLTLSVTPQISGGDGRTVKMKLELEISSISSGTAGGSNLITNKRTLSNVVGVENGQVLVIAGLIDDQIQDQQRGIPLLSSIPVLGSLFRYRAIDKTKKNLMLFIRPTVLRKQSDGDYYTRKKYDSVREAQIDSAINAPLSLIGAGRRPQLEPFDTFRSDLPPPTLQTPDAPSVAPADTEKDASDSGDAAERRSIAPGAAEVPADSPSPAAN
ncbi:type II secretion system secretin GspD [Sinimarinibacterium sp. CAU 1509]|uniref:type II secretion system secretin GspD n=1 Tax=Sinimarinibacterium sp. CAU 1509 TaxID=2562283 RepID=UPI00200AF133|nr:type II secretion system secretin GspD [Sinimarinibacterium sp. CAU 1509]